MIEVKRVTKYYGVTAALRDVSFRIETGEIVGFLGLNGAGKSTALKILAGSLLPTAGSVIIDGIDLLAQPERMRAHIGFLPEKPPLYEEMSVRRYLVHVARLRGLARSRATERTAKVMDFVAIADRAEQTVGTLSLGYKKRLGIAQALVHEPKLVILDEPNSTLDPQQTVQMRKLIRQLRGDHTVLISSHMLAEVQETCDRLLVLREGALVAQGTEAEIRERFNLVGSVEVHVRGDADAIADHMAGLSCVSEYQQVRVNDGIVELQVELTGDEREELASSLIEAGFGLRMLRTAKNDLENAFIAATSQGEGP